MSLLNDFYHEITQSCRLAEEQFTKEISTDENKDYRRGFKAGVLMALLTQRACVGELLNAVDQQPAD